jgi:sulfate transport system substrate-binding protein
VSILAEPPVAVIDKVVDKRRTRNAAEAYLNFLYAPEGQQLAAKHYYRPRLRDVTERYPDRFAKLELMNIEDFGGWAKAYKTHFADGGIFDQIYRPGS